ncbi:MAG: hypothetical protein KAT34_16550, partial [Candidatus Aminicenantes bacterium]|nr:hypothetical protein [Candidatus Aminicenantes bacterium]
MKEIQEKMMKKRIFLNMVLIVSLILLSSSLTVAFDVCGPPPPPPGPGGDAADDNYSVSNFLPEYSALGKGSVSIFNAGYWREAEKLFSHFHENTYLVEITGNSNPEVVVIPSGGLFGQMHNSTLKIALEQYISQGGAVICFAQQYLEDFQVLPKPEGELLSVHGWRNAQSCEKNSVYFENIHPVLSSSSRESVDIAVDGSISTFPGSANVLLKRVVNNEPALIYYKYGSGYVFIFCGYTDWGSSHSQASSEELKVVRDLITFAKDPETPINMYDLAVEPNPQINLNIEVKNSLDEGQAATKAIIKVYTPDNNLVLYETEHGVSLNSGDEVIVPIVFTLPDLGNNHRGIGHTYYELYNDNGDLIQMETEALSGRFAIYKIEQEYTSIKDVDMWITVQNEFIYWFERPTVTVHIKNNKSKSISGELSYDWWHKNVTSIGNFSVAPGQTFSHTFEPELGVVYGYSTSMEGFWMKYMYSDGVSSSYVRARKGIEVIVPRTESNVNLIGPTPVKAGTPINYKIETLNKSPESMTFLLFLSLEKYNFINYRYEKITDLYNTSHTFEVGGTFSNTGQYSPANVLSPGSYRLRLQVEKSVGSRENWIMNFRIESSSVYVKIDPLINAGNQYVSELTAGNSYPLDIYINNRSAINVSNGELTVIMRHMAAGTEIYKKEIKNIELASNEQKVVNDTLVFNPLPPGLYEIVNFYFDESLTAPEIKSHYNKYKYPMSINVTFDKNWYQYGDTAQVKVEIVGTGNVHIEFQCPESGITETREVFLPDGIFKTEEIFQVPIGTVADFMSPYRNVVVMSTFASGQSIENKSKIKVIPITFATSGIYSQTFARAGETIEFQVNMKRSSGFSSPLPGELKVYSSGLNFSDSRAVSIIPTAANLFDYQVAVPESTAVGTYSLYVDLTVGGIFISHSNYPVKIPEHEIKFTEPPVNLSSGDTITLECQNLGGTEGQFEIEIFLKDKNYKKIIDHKETAAITAGGIKTILLQVPTGAKSGSYQISQQAKESNSGKIWKTYSPVQIAGLMASLNSYTLKEKYFENENVAGKSEMTVDTGAITDGLLQAKIIRHMKTTSGFEEQKPGSYVSYNMLQQGFDNGAKLYITTDMGVIEYDKATGNSDVIYEPGYYCNDMLVTGAGEIWVGTYNGAFRCDNGGNWTRYTTADGLVSSFIRDIVEADLAGSPAVWLATSGGVSVFSSGSWTSFTTANGLPSNWIYRIVKDGNGSVWVSTSGGVVKYNGSTFESVSAPFGNASVSNKLTSTADGSIWIAHSSKLYRCRTGGIWDEWNLSDLHPSPLTIYDMEAVEGNLWIRARYRDEDHNYHKILIHYDTGFEIFEQDQVPVLAGLDTYAIIPGSGDGAYFILEFGFLEYKDGIWTAKELTNESDKLAGEVNCLAADQNGNIWAGTVNGISMYDGIKWTNYCATSDREWIYNVYQLSVGSDNSVYCTSTLHGIIKIREGIMEFIPYSSNQLANSYGKVKLAVDNTGRIWTGRSNLYYYDGEWNYFPGPTYSIKSLTSDLENGIWAAAYKYISQYSVRFCLFHIKDDLTDDQYTSYDSGLSLGVKDRIHMDKNGVLWLRHYHGDDWYQYYKLQSFDGNNWVEYKDFDGFPEYGIEDFAVDDNGILYVIDTSYSSNNLYVLRDGVFQLVEENIPILDNLLYSEGKFYCSGGEEIDYSVPDNFLTINIGSAGLVEEEFWSQTYDVNMSSGDNIELDLLTGKNLSTGSYVLKTELFSSLEQV